MGLLSEKLRIYLLYALCALTVVLPVIAALRLAEYESLRSQQDRAALIASEVRRRGDLTVEQMLSALAEFRAAGDKAPCSEGNLELMRRIVVKSNLLIDVGHAQGDVMDCSAFGIRAIDIGPVTYIGSRGMLVRVGAAYPLVPEAKLNLITDPKSGFTMLLSQNSPLDSTPDEPNLAVGVVAPFSVIPFSNRGHVDPAWIARMSKQPAGSFYSGGDVVAWAKSDRAEFLAYAVINGTRVEQDRQRIISVLLPVGIVAGLVLVFIVAYVVRRQTSMPSLLRAAIKHGELSLVYQPIISLQSGQWSGAEALVRWKRPNGESIGPDVFVPLAERSGLISQLTEAVIRLVETEAGGMLRNNPDLYVAINLSASDFASEAIGRRLIAAVERMAVKPGQLHIEATERIFMDVDLARRTIRQIRDTGMKVSIDDFGTGYSSLAYLHSLQVDYLKIDKAFIDTIGSQAVTSQVIEHIINIAQDLDIHLIAEGVEMQAQAQYLREHGVEYAQGYLFSRPLTMTQFLAELSISATDARALGGRAIREQQILELDSGQSAPPLASGSRTF